MLKSIILAIVLTMISLIGFLNHDAYAISIQWTGTGDGVNWSDPNNWNLHRIPVASDSIYIDNNNLIHSIVHLDIDFSPTNGTLVIQQNDSLIVDSGKTLRFLNHVDNYPIIDHPFLNNFGVFQISKNGLAETQGILSSHSQATIEIQSGLSKTSRGSGSGVTWNCYTDSNIANKVTDCNPTWNGGTFSGITDSKVIKNGMVNQWIEFNVTSDVNSFLDGNPNDNFGWIIKKQMRQTVEW